MPTTNTNNQTYQGEAGTIVRAAVQEARSIKEGLVSFAPNVRHIFNIPSLSENGGFVNAACGWSPAGTIVLDNNAVTIKRIMKQREVCTEDFIAAHNEFDDILEAIMEDQMEKASEKFDNDIWVGVVGTTGDFGGLVPLFEADDNVIKSNSGITPTGAVITVDNVLSELSKAVAAIPSKIRKKQDLKIVVASNVALAYEQLLITNGVTYLADGGERGLKYGRYTIIEVPYLEDNTVIAYQVANVWTVTDSQNPENTVVADSTRQHLTGNVDTKVAFGGGAGYAHPEEIVYYVSTVTPA